jgi:hypothetical protein
MLRRIKSSVVKPFGYEVATRTETQTKTVDFIRLAEKDNITPLKLIRLGGKLYKIRYTEEDKQRRNDYFINGTGSLTADETKLLNDIGLKDIDEQLSINDKKLMPTFYNSLPDCQTSTAISLSAKCFMPHHIISEIIEHAALTNEIDNREYLEKKPPTSDQPSKTAALLNGISGLISGSFPSESESETGAPSMADESSMYDFFLLRV